jgi:hypothetical protein
VAYIAFSGHVNVNPGVPGAKFLSGTYYCLDKTRGGSSGSLCSKYFFAYIGWTKHVEAIGDISGATFLFSYIGWTSHGEAVIEVSGATFSSHI